MMGIGTSSVQTIEQKVRSLTKLSTLPYIPTKVVELVENPKTSASTLGKLISMDQILTARILKLANSAYYGFPRQISTINLAIVVLGFNTLRDMVMSISMIDQFGLKENQFIEPRQFWRHALAVGMGARALSKMIHYPVPGEVFVGGLIHDIGLAVLFEEFPEVLLEAREYAQSEAPAKPLGVAMRESVGFSPAEVGAWLVEEWNLPTKLVSAIRYHDRPADDPDNTPLTRLIYLADRLSNTIKETAGLDYMEPISADKLETELNLFFGSQNPLSYYRENFLEHTTRAGEFLGMLSA